MTKRQPTQPDPVRGAAAEVHVDPETSGAPSTLGTVRIAPAVLIELIELTLQDIEGVAGLRNHPVDKSTAPDGARTFDNGKIAVTVDGNQITAAVGCAISRGTNVTELSAVIQKAVGLAAGNMLGMTVLAVDIYIQDIVSAPADT